jgi:hypothetical protein
MKKLGLELPMRAKGIYPPPHELPMRAKGMYPPPHITCMYPPPHTSKCTSTKFSISANCFLNSCKQKLFATGIYPPHPTLQGVRRLGGKMVFRSGVFCIVAAFRLWRLQPWGLRTYLDSKKVYICTFFRFTYACSLGGSGCIWTAKRHIYVCIYIYICIYITWYVYIHYI